jgi:hypothetical protein
MKNRPLQTLRKLEAAGWPGRSHPNQREREKLGWPPMMPMRRKPRARLTGVDRIARLVGKILRGSSAKQNREKRSETYQSVDT